MVKKSDEKPIGYEVRHISYCTDKNNENDLLVIKEYQHFANGERTPYIRLVHNMKRPVYIVKKPYRNYEEIQQYISEEYLDKYESTNCLLYRQINKVLGKRYRSNYDAFKNVYVFGCGISPVSYIKALYKNKFGDNVTPMSSVAVLDVETETVDGTWEIVLSSITMKDKAFCAVTKQYLRGKEPKKFLEDSYAVTNELLADVIKERGINVEIKIVENAGEAAALCIAKAHEWQPDFLEFWNIDFDMTKIIEALEKYGYNLEDVFSDPKVPKEYRFFKYKRGSAMKTTQSGKMRSLANFERWHKVYAPCGFFFVCGMSSYYQFRIAKGKIPGGYSLEATLNRHLKRGKLKFDKCDHLVKSAWHKAMQRDYPHQYIAYNLFDCIGVEMLDEQIKDICLKFNTRCVTADYHEFSSGPTLGVNKLNRICNSLGLQIAVNSGEVRTEKDKLVVGPRHWTVVLPCELIADSNVKIIKDFPNLSSLVFLNVSDLDIISTYPSVQTALNISKSTTIREVVGVTGLSERVKRRVFLNTTCGISNHIQVCRDAFKLPGLTDIHRLYLNRDKTT